MGCRGPVDQCQALPVFLTGAHVILVSSIKLGWMDFPVFFHVLSYLEATKNRAGHLWIGSLVCLQLSKPSRRLLIQIPGGHPVTPTYPPTQPAFLRAYSLASSSVCRSVSSLTETFSRPVQSWFFCCWPRDPFHSLCMWPSLVEIHLCDVFQWLSVGPGAPASGPALPSCPCGRSPVWARFSWLPPPFSETGSVDLPHSGVVKIKKMLIPCFGEKKDKRLD